MDITLGGVREFLDTDMVGGTTVNFIREPVLGPLTFTSVLLIVAAVLFAVLLFRFMASRRSMTPRAAAVRASVASFVIVGVLFALRMDLNWAAMLVHDVRAYAGKDVGERVVELKGRDLHDFMAFVREKIPEGEMARQLDIPRTELAHFIYGIGKYYLLPVRTSRSGGYVWVNRYIPGSYEPRTRTLKVYGHEFEAVPHAVYDEDSVLFRVLKERP